MPSDPYASDTVLAPVAAPAEPPPEAPEDAWTPARLGDALAQILAKVGSDRFLGGTIVLPTDKTFPRFAPTLPWARAVTARLMGLAGLDAFAVDIEPFDGGPRPGLGPWQPLFHRDGEDGDAQVLAWFAGFEGDVCRLGLDMRRLTEPEVAVAALAHEVAHAYRQHHGLVVADRALEEDLTDLTTVVLGFGVLVTNAAYRFLQTGGMEGRQNWVAWRHERAGYLPWIALSWLLAAQLSARGEGPTRDVLGQLERTQADAVRRFLAEGLALDALGLPAPGTTPRAELASTPASEVPRPELDARDWLAHFKELDRARALSRHEGLPVFRVARSESRMRILLATAGLAIGAGIAFGLGLGTGPFVAIAAGLVIVGVTIGGRLERTPIDECSDCPADIPPDATTCPGCGGTVAGRLVSRDERLAAREALERGPAASDDDDDDDADDELVEVEDTELDTDER